jgi:general secretion pathway protein C
MAVITGKDLLMLCQQPSPRLRALVHVVLILLLCFSLARLTWLLWPAPELPALRPVAGQPARVAVGGGQTGLAAQIPQWHLFGEVVQEVSAPKPVDLPETNLKLTLRGLIASTNPAEARAIVADPSGKENSYRIGDKLPGNAELTEIHADRIVIKRGGRYETLKLPKESLDMGASTAVQSTARPAVAPRNTYSLRQYRDTLLNDPQKVADLVRINPAYIQGKFAGFKLEPGRDPAFLSRYGLRPGDVVTAVNGVQLDSPAKGLSVMKDLATANSLNLVVERNGVRQSYTLSVN